MKTLGEYVMGEKNRRKGLMVFDWDRAAMRITEEQAETIRKYNTKNYDGAWSYQE